MDATTSILVAVARADLFIVRVGGALLGALRAVSVAVLIFLLVGLIALMLPGRQGRRGR